ncbi:hypothetical protein [Winogradskyella sp.]|uniref:hypothetical protein n=1 Tax=Winogradskyella sp. TaxID=1883156 RepID=UPI003BA9A16B
MLSKFYLKSSSLSNTIFICVIISVLCGCLVFIAHYQNILIDKLEFSEELINTNNASFNYFLSNYSTLDEENNTIDIFNTGITTTGIKKKWGFYDVLICTTGFKTDTIVKSALIGKSSDSNDKLALYVTDYDNILKLSGKSSIIGDIKVPKGATERGYIDNKIKTSLTIKGTTLKSEDVLPKISDVLDYGLFDTEMQSLSDFNSRSIFNEFSKPTLVINVSDNTTIEELELKGNIILFSKNPMDIETSNTIEDILVIAPSVVIAPNFTGNLQIISEEHVEINNGALLKYPSSIYVENDIDSISVSIKKDAKIAGGIVINGNTYSGSLKRHLSIAPDSQIIGDVYCYGETQLEGEITGTVYSDRFVLKTKSSEYENMIQNCNIDSERLPKNFVRLPLFNTENSRYEVIKEF